VEVKSSGHVQLQPRCAVALQPMGWCGQRLT
jgi:hypothetical protein